LTSYVSTLCPKKVVHQTHSDNFVNSTRIFKILSLLEREVNFQQNHVILSTIPSVCCHTTLRKLEVRICSNFQKKQSKNCVKIDNNWNAFCHMAEYCHSIVARSVHLFPAHKREDVRATRQLHCQWWSDQWHVKHAVNAASVHNTCLDIIVCYLQRIFNRNQKLKQQVSK